MNEENKMAVLNDFGGKFMALKKTLLDLNLQSQENVRIAIQYLDDGFMRAREAIFSTDPEAPVSDDKEEVIEHPVIQETNPEVENSEPVDAA